MLKQLTIASLGLFLSAGALLAETPVDRLAPSNSVFVFSTKSMKTAREHIKATKMWSLWQSDQFKSPREEFTKKFNDGMKEMYEQLGVEEGSLTCPDGPFGLAVFPVMNEELGVPEIGFLLVSDWGENAEKTNTLFQAALAEGEKKGELEYEQKDVLGRTVYSIEPIVKDDEDAGDEELNPLEGVPAPDEMFDGLKTMHLVRDGSTFLACSNLDSLTDALEVIDGKGEPGLDQRAEYQGIMKQIGSDGDFSAVVLVEGLTDLLAGQDGMGMAMMVVPMIQSVVGDIQGAGVSVRCDGTAMLEQKFSVYMPNGKQGISALLDVPAPRGEMPRFVGPDAVSYTTLHFKFSGLLDVIKQVLAMNPMMQVPPEEMAQLEQMVQQVTSTLGTEIHTVKTASKADAAGVGAVTAIQCVNPQGFENFFAQFAPQMGLQPRDFLGQRIYSMDPAMMGMPGMQPISLGVGGGYVLIGPTPAVEQSLRATSQPQMASLASDSQFKYALGSLNDENAVAWGYTDTVDSIEASLVGMQQQLKAQAEEIRQFDPEMADSMLKEAEEQLKWIKELDFDVLRKYIGPSIWQVRSTEEGFVGAAYLLEPAQQP